MAAFGECLRCGVVLLDAAAWRVHELTYHAPKGERTCLFCGRVYLNELFAWHACVGELFSASRHPSNRGAS